MIALRHQLEDELGFDLPEETWSYLVHERYIDEVEEGLSTISALGDVVRKLSQAFGGPTIERARRPRTVPAQGGSNDTTRGMTRQLAVSSALAWDAARREEVRGFRNEALDGGLLELDGVESWVKCQAQVDGSPTRWVEIPLPANSSIERREGGLAISTPLKTSPGYPVSRVSTRALSYVAADGKTERVVATSRNGTLERLRGLSVLLADDYGWQEAQSTVFVLTGRTPLLDNLVGQVRLKTSFSAVSRITLTIDPALSPRDVAEGYGRIRRQVLGGRHRDLTEKHRQLALFSMRGSKDETWAEQMSDWNQEHPQWLYNTPTNYARDASQAQRRLLHPTYAWGYLTEEEHDE